MEPWVVSTSLIAIYLLVCLGLGFVAGQRLKVNMDDFIMYGRRAGFFVLYFSVVSTYHSAFAFLGSGGFFYRHGIGFWDAGTWTLLVGLITYVFGTRIWILGKRFGYMTPADMLADYYGSEGVRILVALVSVIFTLLYIQVQSLGLGYILSAATGDRISVSASAAVLMGVALVYISLGGIRAVYWTDVFQGIWMYVVIWAGALFLAYKLFGGPLELWQAVIENRPDLLTIPGPEGFFTYPMWFGFTITLSFGIVFQPHMFMRYFTAAGVDTIKRLGATTPIYLASIYIPAALVGLGGAVALPGLEVPDTVFPTLLSMHAPAWLTGVVLAGASAAAMSTLNGIVHSNMTVITRDIYQRYIRPAEPEAHYVWAGRVIIVALMSIGYWLSVANYDFLVVIVTLSGSGALQLWPAIMGNLFPSKFKFTKAGVMAGMITGIVTLYLALVLQPHPLGLHGGIWATIANFAVAIFASKFTAPPPPATIERIHGALEKELYGSPLPPGAVPSR
jgi:SSS family solute:Na+ symporter